MAEENQAKRTWKTAADFRDYSERGPQRGSMWRLHDVTESDSGVDCSNDTRANSKNVYEFRVTEKLTTTGRAI